MLSPRLLFVTAVHSIFSQYGDIMSACLNLMNVPIKGFFNESIQSNYGPMSDHTFELAFSACSSSMFLGLMIGFGMMGYLMDRVGRKETGVVLRGILGIVGSVSMILAFLTNRCEFYVFGHILAGAITGLKVVLIIYVAECTPDKKRGLTSMSINSGGVAMVMAVTPLCLPDIIGTSTMWYILPCICGLMASIHIFIAIRFPQSPKQLYIQQNNELAAREAILFYHGNDSAVDDVIMEMSHEKQCQSQESASLIDILKNRRNRFVFFLVLLCAFVPVFSAVNVKSQYLCSMLITYGLTQSQSTTAMMIISALSFPLCFLSPFLIQKYGRRPIFVTVTILCALEWVGFAVAQLLVDVNAEDLTLSWLSASISSVLGQSAVNMGLLIMSPIMISEICPQNTRASISQLTQVFPIAFAVAEVSLFPSIQSSFGASAFFFLGASCAALAVLLHKMMMEPHDHHLAHLVRRLDYLNKDGTLPTMTRQLWKSSYGSISSSDSSQVSFSTI